MKYTRKILAILCALALAACCLPLASADEANPAAARTMTVGEAWNGDTAGTETAVLLKVASAGKVHLMAEGKGLSVTVIKAGDYAEHPEKTAASGKANGSGQLHLSWKADKTDYYVILSASGSFSLKILDNQGYTELTEVPEETEEKPAETEAAEEEEEEQPVSEGTADEPETEAVPEKTEEEPAVTAEEPEETEQAAETEPQEPAEEPQEPAEEPQEPAEEPQEPAEEPQEPAEEPQEPAEEPQEPAEEPEEEPQEPVEEPEEPAEEPQEPEEEPEEPAEEPQEPEEEPQEPEEEPQEPAEEPEEPAEEPQEPAEEPQEPAEEPQEPAEEPEEPAEEPEEPAEEPQEPAEEPQEPAEEPEKPAEEPKAEEPSGGLEVVIAKTLQPGDSWNGTLKRKTPTVLKLDLDKPQQVHMLVEGKNIWAAVRKSDLSAEDSPKEMTDPETNRAIVAWEAEAGSYLISLGPNEGSLMAKATVTIMDQGAYEAWEAENVPAVVEEPEPAEEPESEEEPEPGIPRSIRVNVTWDSPDPVIGDTAHFAAELEGYEGLAYTMQWQYSPDHETWIDLPGETGETMDIVVTEENNVVYWRIVVYVEEQQED